MKRTPAGTNVRAFSLVEILIVVTIIGILAAIAVPKFANASQLARESSVKDNLRQLRTQIGVYRAQHLDIAPGFPGGDITQTPTSQVATDQLVKYSDNQGNTSDASTTTYVLGPYLSATPENAVNNNATFKILAPTDTFTPDGTSGWLYQPSTGLIKVNVVGNDSNGKSFVEY